MTYLHDNQPCPGPGPLPLEPELTVEHGHSKAHRLLKHDSMVAEAKSYKDHTLQLRAEPVFLEISDATVFDTKVGDWMKTHRGRYVTIVLFAIQFCMRVKVPGSTRVETQFDGVHHTMWHRTLTWVILDFVSGVTLIVFLLHYANRDLIKRQILGFDCLVIVGNYTWWFVTRGFSESCVFSDTFTTERMLLHFFEASFFLPLMVVAACMDSVKLPHRTKVGLLILMVVERLYQYYLHRGDEGVFSSHGICPLWGHDTQIGNVQGTHLSSNMTIIVFLLKSIKAYSTGYQFALVKPIFTLVVRKPVVVSNGEGLPPTLPESSLPIGRPSDDACGQDDAGDPNPKGCCQAYNPEQAELGLQLPLPQSDVGLSQEGVPSFECPQALHGGGGSGCATDDAVLESDSIKGPTDDQESQTFLIRSVPAVESAWSANRRQNSPSPGDCRVSTPSPPLAGLERESTAGSSGVRMFAELRRTLADMVLTTGALSGGEIEGNSAARSPATLTPRSSLPQPVAMTPPPTGDAADGSVNARVPPLSLALVQPAMSGTPSDSADVASLTRVRNETSKLIAAYERDLLVFRGQQAILDAQISELMLADVQRGQMEVCTGGSDKIDPVHPM